MKIEIGHPLILKDAKGLKKHGLHKNMEGVCNNIVTVENDETYVMFQPTGVQQFYWIKEDRLVVDEDKLPDLEG